jgi:murein DD-endopeptidase MepM/ murein hydrolase activator NlpD
MVLVLLPICIVALVLLLRPRGESEQPEIIPTPVARIVTFPPSTSTGRPAPLLDDGRLLFEPGWGVQEVRAFLQSRPGVLGQWRCWVGDREMPLPDVIAGQSLFYGVNPKVLLTLLETQSGLVDDPDPSPDALDWAMGHRNNGDRGLEAQIVWAVREIYRAKRDYPGVSTLSLEDGETVPLPEDGNLGSYAVLRLVGLTGNEAGLRRVQGTGQGSFVQTYRRLFDEDPRLPLIDGSPSGAEPFLVRPFAGEFEVTSIFDHHYPTLRGDGSLVSSLGQEAAGLPYDGHNGWDYALDFGVPVLAAADGVVIWAGNSNDGCATAARGAVLDHGNGYQTLYWHLDRVDVSVGQSISAGEVLGLAGASGCAEGPHLHFGVHLMGRETDPEGWCGQGPDPWSLHPAGATSQWLWADRYSPCLWPEKAVLVDETDAGFRWGGTDWSEGQGGVGGRAMWTFSGPRSGVVPVDDQGQLDGVVEAGTWRPDLPYSGYYRVYAFIPYWNNNTPDTQAAHYVVHHADGEDMVLVDQALYVHEWVDLGVFPFTRGGDGFVYLDNLTGEVGFCVWFDAMLWVPESIPGLFVP